MKTVAFLQNMWVKPHQVPKVQRWASTSEEREGMIHYALFAGCKTGRTLKLALGDDLCAQIIWQEASPVIADNPKDYHAPDAKHIWEVLNKHQPDSILCLTRTGQEQIFVACRNWCAANGRPPMKFVSAPHPAARGAHVFADLQEAARRLVS